MATEPMMSPRAPPAGASPRERRAASAPSASVKSSSLTPAGIATTRSGGTPAAITSWRMASPLVITRSASHRYTGSGRRTGTNMRVRSTGAP